MVPCHFAYSEWKFDKQPATPVKSKLEPLSSGTDRNSGRSLTMDSIKTSAQWDVWEAVFRYTWQTSEIPWEILSSNVKSLFFSDRENLLYADAESGIFSIPPANVSFFCPLPAIIKSTPAKSDSYIAFANTDIDLLHNFFISAYSNLIIFLEFFSLWKSIFPYFFSLPVCCYLLWHQSVLRQPIPAIWNQLP